MTEIEKFEQVKRYSPFPDGCVPPADEDGNDAWPSDYVSESEFDALLSLARKQAEELAKMPKWIAVEHELPKHCVEVLVWNGSEHGIDWINEHMHDGHEWMGDSSKTPTHWAPLLTPPSTEETLNGAQ